MENCLFCKIIKKEISAEIIYEDNMSMAILDVHPKTTGHTMILPKNHAENILDLTDKEIGDVFKAVKKVVAILSKSLKPDGFTIGINHGKVSGQAIDHLHIHVMPRWHGDKGGSIHVVVDNPPKETLEEIKKKIIH
ncbi:MAG: HIT family protein [Patescibacteria group bacterium]